MPKRKIVIPETIKFKNPETGEPIPDASLSFVDFVHKLFANPLWAESYRGALAQQSIRHELKNAGGALAIEIAEEDWNLLAQCVREPRIATPAGIAPGFGINPAMSSQFVPLMRAVIEAEQV